jgi:hypothetical protein
MKRADVVIAGLVMLAVFGLVFAGQMVTQAKFSSQSGEVVAVGSCVPGYYMPRQIFCSKPIVRCKTKKETATVGPLGLPYPDGCDIYEDANACSLRWGADAAGTEANGSIQITTRPCGVGGLGATYKYQLCDDNWASFCIKVGSAVDMDCPGEHPQRLNHDPC